jgi:hypothetical protein
MSEKRMLVSDTAIRRAPTEILWGEAAPIEHSVQIYTDDSLFIDALEGYASGGLRLGEAVIVIATKAHRRALERRLRARGCDLDKALAEDRYVPVDAEEALSQFMVDGQPDESLFNQVIDGLFARASAGGRQVRAFGEMVVLLWNDGNNSATVRLEHLWNQYLERAVFCLFCAYPRSSFSEDAAGAMQEICSHHSRIIPEYFKARLANPVGADLCVRPFFVAQLISLPKLRV